MTFLTRRSIYLRDYLTCHPAVQNCNAVSVYLSLFIFFLLRVSKPSNSIQIKNKRKLFRRSVLNIQMLLVTLSNQYVTIKMLQLLWTAICNMHARQDRARIDERRSSWPSSPGTRAALIPELVPTRHRSYNADGRASSIVSRLKFADSPSIDDH